MFAVPQGTAEPRLGITDLINRVRLTRHLGGTGGKNFHIAFWSESPKEDSHLEGLDVDGRTILNLKKQDGVSWAEVFRRFSQSPQADDEILP